MTITTYSGFNATPTQYVNGDPKTQHDAFIAAITGTTTEDFEAIAIATKSAAFTVLGTGSLGFVNAYDALAVSRVTNVTTSGRFNTTGATAAPVAGRWYETGQSIYVTFPASHSAFGFYITDNGDFNGVLAVVPLVAGVAQAPIYITSGISTTLSSGIDNSTTTIPVTSGANIANGDYIVIVAEGANTAEVVLVTAGGGTASLTATRAQAGTSASAHAAGAVVGTTNGVTSGTLSFFGITDSVDTYSGFKFLINQKSGTPHGQYDNDGIDDIVIGDLVAPPPAAVPLYVSVGRARRF